MKYEKLPQDIYCFPHLGINTSLYSRSTNQWYPPNRQHYLWNCEKIKVWRYAPLKRGKRQLYICSNHREATMQVENSINRINFPNNVHNPFSSQDTWIKYSLMKKSFNVEKKSKGWILDSVYKLAKQTYIKLHQQTMCNQQS